MRSFCAIIGLFLRTETMITVNGHARPVRRRSFPDIASRRCDLAGIPACRARRPGAAQTVRWTVADRTPC